MDGKQVGEGRYVGGETCEGIASVGRTGGGAAGGGECRWVDTTSRMRAGV